MRCREEGIHSHKKDFPIIMEINAACRQWAVLAENFLTTVKKSQESYDKVEPLIVYFEKEFIKGGSELTGNQKLISKHFKELIKKNE